MSHGACLAQQGMPVMSEEHCLSAWPQEHCLCNDRRACRGTLALLNSTAPDHSPYTQVSLQFICPMPPASHTHPTHLMPYLSVTLSSTHPTRPMHPRHVPTWPWLRPYLIGSVACTHHQVNQPQVPMGGWLGDHRRLATPCTMYHVPMRLATPGTHRARPSTPTVWGSTGSTGRYSPLPSTPMPSCPHLLTALVAQGGSPIRVVHSILAPEW